MTNPSRLLFPFGECTAHVRPKIHFFHRGTAVEHMRSWSSSGRFQPRGLPQPSHNRPRDPNSEELTLKEVTWSKGKIIGSFQEALAAKGTGSAQLLSLLFPRSVSRTHKAVRTLLA